MLSLHAAIVIKRPRQQAGDLLFPASALVPPSESSGSRRQWNDGPAASQQVLAAGGAYNIASASGWMMPKS